MVRKDLEMGKGKLAVQVAHASLEAYLKGEKIAPEKTRIWLRSGAKKVVVWAKDLEELLDIFSSIPENIPKVIIRDAGHTQIPPGTITCIGIGPYDDEILDKYTGHLRLV